MITEELLTFTRDKLLHKADEVIRNSYKDYCEGADIDIQTKSDNTPATRADREVEEVLRTTILTKYSDHGIQGEEFGSFHPDADWIWVLDPLDGTREFLAKKAGNFGTLIGLLFKGEACLGAISDPVTRKRWLSDKGKVIVRTNRLEKSVVACTNPESMFESTELRRGIEKVQKKALEIKTDLNCMGFAGVVDGDFDAAIENNLKAHDIIPLLPIMLNAGLVVVDLSGIDYATYRFDTEDAFTNRYGVIAASNPKLAKEILNSFQEEVN